MSMSKVDGYRYTVARDRDFIPMDIFDELDRFVVHGLAPSNFIYQCLVNNLTSAANGASPVNQACLCNIARFIHRNVPWACRGSEKSVREWKGLTALDLAAAEEREADG